MIDIHSHILHGVDDGPATLEESIEMIRLALKEGIFHIIATPHYKLPKYDSSSARNTFSKLLEAIRDERLEIGLSLGNELYLDEAAMAALDSQDCMTLAGSRYVLIELPEYKLYPFHEQLLYEIQLKGYRIILAHIDRYDYFMKDLSFLRTMICKGCYTQMNAAAVLEKSTRKKALELIDIGLVHFMAADWHSIKKRAPSLKKAYQLVEARAGTEKANELFKDNSNFIIDNQPLPIEWAAEYSKKKRVNKFLARLGCIK